MGAPISVSLQRSSVLAGRSDADGGRPGRHLDRPFVGRRRVRRLGRASSIPQATSASNATNVNVRMTSQPVGRRRHGRSAAGHRNRAQFSEPESRADLDGPLQTTMSTTHTVFIRDRDVMYSMVMRQQAEAGTAGSRHVDMPDSTVDDEARRDSHADAMPNNPGCGTEPLSGTKESKLAPRKLLYLLAVTTALFIVSASQGAAQYHEAPMLAEMVARGDLPPVNERLPDNPSMLDAPTLEIGEYGGTARVVAGSMNDLIAEPYVGRYVLQFSAEGDITGDIAEDFELSDDNKVLTIHLRPGLRWSDGAPFTADDIIFRFKDMHWFDEVRTVNPYPEVTGVVKVDDYTLRLESEQPNPGIVLKMATWRGGNWTVFAPKHYLSQWHINYNDDANANAREEGFDSWEQALSGHEGYPYNIPTDVDKPTLDPWRTADLNPDLVWTRNPYYHRVDAAGKQLPYIDEVVAHRVQDQDPQVLSLKIIQGEVDIAYSRLSLDQFAELKEQEDTGDYSVTLIRGLESASVGVALNLNHPDERRAELYQDARFRYALSLAIDRDEVNDNVYYGLAVPRQSAPIPNPTYYRVEWAQAYATYDPKRANALLDEIGMTTRDPDGLRLAPWGGEPLEILIEFPEHPFSRLRRPRYDQAILEVTRHRCLSQAATAPHIQRPP